MGEQADILIDQMWDFDPRDEEPIATKTCRCCGKTGLHWDMLNSKWRLHDNRGIHVCPVNPLKERAPRVYKKKDTTEWAPLPAGYVMSEARRKY